MVNWLIIPWISWFIHLRIQKIRAYQSSTYTTKSSVVTRTAQSICKTYFRNNLFYILFYIRLAEKMRKRNLLI